MSFWLRAASLPDRPPMAVNLLSIDVIFSGGHKGAVRSVQQFWGLRACARSAGAVCGVLEAWSCGVGGVRRVRPPLRGELANKSASSLLALARSHASRARSARRLARKAVDGWPQTLWVDC